MARVAHIVKIEVQERNLYVRLVQKLAGPWQRKKNKVVKCSLSSVDNKSNFKSSREDDLLHNFMGY